MTLIEEASGAAAVAEPRDDAPQWGRAVVKICMMVIGVAGVGAITLGWTALLAKGVVWLAGL
jgi:hypothetical protein